MARLAEILPLAQYFATATRTPQVVWECAAVDTHGRTPLPEFNQKHAGSCMLRVVKVVKP